MLFVASLQLYMEVASYKSSLQSGDSFRKHLRWFKKWVHAGSDDAVLEFVGHWPLFVGNCKGVSPSKGDKGVALRKGHVSVQMMQ